MAPGTAAVSDRLPRLSDVELAVLASGVTSMGLEILAGRIVAPEFGSSIFTWGAIIAVFLAALSAGYAVGGRRAPERASESAVVRVLVQSALFVAFVLVAADGVLRVADALPVPGRFAPLVPVAMLFGPPVFLLGFVSPYAAELSGEPTAGSASGRVYALGTVGSIVGAFATTFFLVPSFDVTAIEVGFGAVLLLAAAKVAPGWNRQDWTRIAVAGLVLVAAVVVGTTGVTAGESTVYETQTPYQYLRVADDDGVRTMYLDGAPQSATYLDGSNRYVFDYTRYFHVPMLLQEDVDRVLFVGGGGFSGPKRYLAEYPDVEVDVVEIDPEVIRVAREYFGVEDSPRLQVYNRDGREFLENTDRTYDVIVLDAYRSDRVPFHMTTVEFMRLVSDRLDEDGAMVANVISAESGPGSAFYRAQYETIRQAFPHVYSFPTADTPLLQNIEVAATKGEGVSAAEFRRLARERDVGINLTDEVARYHGPSTVRTDDVPVLRDDRAPVDRLLDEQLGRRYVLTRNETATAPSVARPAAVARPSVTVPG